MMSITNREEILKKIQKLDDRLFVSKILDKAQKAQEWGKVIHSDFADPYQQNLIGKLLTGRHETSYTLYGGYEGAERAVVILHPDFILPEDDELYCQFFKLLYIHSKTREVLSHRDYLGSLMGLGIKREKIGDIIVHDVCCNVIVLSEVAEYVSYNLTNVGNARVSVEIKEIDEICVPEFKQKDVKATVASMRLDCISSAGFGISRGKAAELIRSERLNLNWETVDSPTKQVKEGDTISIRGKGRIVLEKITGNTRKGRIGIVLKKLV